MTNNIYPEVIYMSLLSLITNLFTGCNNKEPDTPSRPVSFPEGTCLTEMYISHQGMAREPYYVLLTTDEGIVVRAVYDTACYRGLRLALCSRIWHCLGQSDCLAA